MKEKNNQIQGLRGTAALMVVIFHYYCRFFQIYDSGSKRADDPIISQFAVIGVFTFLLISGLYLDRDDKRCTIREAAGKFVGRLKKLYLPYLLCITLIFIVTNAYGLPERTVGVKDFLLNAVWINGFIGTPYVDGDHWYITTLVASLFCFGLLSCTKEKLRKILTVCWIIALLALTLTVDHVSDGTLHKLMIGVRLLLGSAYAPIIIAGNHIPKERSAKFKPDKYEAFLFALIAVYVFLVWDIVTVIELLLLCAVVFLCATQRCAFMANRPLVFVGNISYPLYLIHQNIGFVLIIIFREHLGFINELIIPIIVFAIIFGLSVLIDRIIALIRQNTRSLIDRKKLKTD